MATTMKHDLKLLKFPIQDKEDQIKLRMDELIELMHCEKFGAHYQQEFIVRLHDSYTVYEPDNVILQICAKLVELHEWIRMFQDDEEL